MRPSGKLYSPLRQGLLAEDKKDGTPKVVLIRHVLVPALKNGIIMLLALSNLAFFIHMLWIIREDKLPLSYAITASLPTTWTRFEWYTDYSSKNWSLSDKLWDDILPSHGIIAIDRQEAAKHHWPKSMSLPSDGNKAVYLLEAYHQLHCLKIIRKTLWQAVYGLPYTYEPSIHTHHCFDALRQAIQCNADNTPLYTFGDNTAGNKQLHKCRDWETLSEFATAQTACYKDSQHPILLGDHFGHCDNGSDNLLVPAKAAS